MRERLSKFFRLSGARRRLLLEALCLLVLVGIGIRALRFGTLTRFLGWLARIPASESQPNEVAWAIEAGSRGLGSKASCLIRALCADAMLRRRKIPSRLFIGVRGPPGTVSPSSLSAHAWVASLGQVVIGNTDELWEYSELKN